MEESGNTDNDFDGISKRSVQQAREGLAQAERHLFRRVAKQLDKGVNTRFLGRRSAYLCKGHDCEETEAKAQGGIPVEIMSDGTEGYKDQEDIEVRGEEIPIEGRAPAGLPLGLQKAHHARAKTGGGVVRGQERRALGVRHEGGE